MASKLHLQTYSGLVGSSANKASRGNLQSLKMNTVTSRPLEYGSLLSSSCRHSESVCLHCGSLSSLHANNFTKKSYFKHLSIKKNSKIHDTTFSQTLFPQVLKSHEMVLPNLNHQKRKRLITSNAMEAMRDVSMFDSSNLSTPNESLVESNPIYSTTPLTQFYPPSNRADDMSLKNPLLRLNRMGCGWLAVILEWEGVVVEDDVNIERKAWIALAEEEARSHPMEFILKRVEGMKKEHAIAEVLCWSRDFKTMKRLATRHEEIYQEMQGGCYRLRAGAKEFIETLRQYKIPIAMASTRPRQSLGRAIEAVGLENVFDVVLASEDVYRGKPDPEMFEYAAQKLNFIPDRCIVIGNSNISVEAAHDALMKCVAVSGKHPAYELSAAELVVRRLDELSVVDLKNLVAVDSPEFSPPEPVPELELDPEAMRNTKPVITSMNVF